MQGTMHRDNEKIRGELFGFILEADRRGAAELLGTQVSLMGFPVVIKEIINPVLHTVGERFLKDKLSLAQGYVAGKIAEDLLERLNSSTEGVSSTGQATGIAVIGNAEDDYHSLGRRMVGTFLKMAGWKVIDLGNDVLAPTFLDKAEESGASVIGVSTMMVTNARNILKVREEIERRSLVGKMKLAVGGAVFTMRPEMVAEVGGDGTAATAMEAPELFARLQARTRSGE
jgi:methanogenic corrinoid protein MtbC1